MSDIEQALPHAAVSGESGSSEQLRMASRPASTPVSGQQADAAEVVTQPNDQELTGLADEPVRRFSHAGKVAHLIAFGTDFGSQPYATAYCGWAPDWPGAWLGSGSWQEEQEANRLPTCKRCNAAARETREFVEGLRRDLGMAPA